MRPTLLAVSVVVLTAARPAVAQENLITKVTPADLRRLALRYDGTARDASQAQNGTIYSVANPKDSGFLCAETKTFETLRIYSRLKATPDMRKLNGWNRDRLYGKAYLAQDGGVIFENVLLLRGGVSSANVRAFIDQHFEELLFFREYIKE